MLRAYLALRDKAVLRPYVAGLRSVGGTISKEGGSSFNELWTSMQLSEARLSAALSEQVLGFRARVGFREGLRRSVLWFERFGLLPSVEIMSESSERCPVTS